jgi:hypothetical protein
VVDYARDVDRTKRREAEFAEKNAEKKEGVIEKKLSVRLCDLSDLRFVDFIRSHIRPGNFRCVCPIVAIDLSLQ